MSGMGASALSRTRTRRRIPSARRSSSSMAPACRASAARGAIHDARPAPSRKRAAAAAQPSTHSASSQPPVVFVAPVAERPLRVLLPALIRIGPTCC